MCLFQVQDFNYVTSHVVIRLCHTWELRVETPLMVEVHQALWQTEQPPQEDKEAAKAKIPSAKRIVGSKTKTKPKKKKSTLSQMAENMAPSFQQLNEQLEAQHQQQQRRPLSFNSNGGAAAARVSPEHENGRTFTAEEAVVRDKSSAVTNKSAPSGAERSDR